MIDPIVCNSFPRTKKAHVISAGKCALIKFKEKVVQLSTRDMFMSGIMRYSCWIVYPSKMTAFRASAAVVRSYSFSDSGS